MKYFKVYFHGSRDPMVVLGRTDSQVTKDYKKIFGHDAIDEVEPISRQDTEGMYGDDYDKIVKHNTRTEETAVSILTGYNPFAGGLEEDKSEITIKTDGNAEEKKEEPKKEEEGSENKDGVQIDKDSPDANGDGVVDAKDDLNKDGKVDKKDLKIAELEKDLRIRQLEKEIEETDDPAPEEKMKDANRLRLKDRGTHFEAIDDSGKCVKKFAYNNEDGPYARAARYEGQRFIEKHYKKQLGEETEVDEGLFDRTGDKVAKAKKALANGMPKHVVIRKFMVTSKELEEETIDETYYEVQFYDKNGKPEAGKFSQFKNEKEAKKYFARAQKTLKTGQGEYKINKVRGMMEAKVESFNKIDAKVIKTLKAMDTEDAMLIIQGLPKNLQRQAKKALGIKETVDGRTKAFKETAARLMKRKESKTEIEEETIDEGKDDLPWDNNSGNMKAGELMKLVGHTKSKDEAVQVLMQKKKMSEPEAEALMGAFLMSIYAGKSEMEEETDLEEYRKPTAAEIEADRKKDARAGRRSKSGGAQVMTKSKQYRGMMGRLKEEETDLEEASFDQKFQKHLKFAMSDNPNVKAYMQKKAAMRLSDMISKDPNAMNPLILDKPKAHRKARKAGVPQSTIRTQTRGRLPEEVNEAREDVPMQVARLILGMGVRQSAPESEILRKIPFALKKLGLQNDKLIQRDPDFQGEVIDIFRGLKEEALDEMKASKHFADGAREIKKIAGMQIAKEYKATLNMLASHLDKMGKAPNVLQASGIMSDINQTYGVAARSSDVKELMDKAFKKVGLMEEAELDESQGPCWDGYEKVPGKDDYEDGSCRKIGEEDELTESPMVTFTVPNVDSAMASKLERIAKEKNIEYSRKGRTVVLKGKRIDITMLRTKMGLAQTNIPMVPVKEEVEEGKKPGLWANIHAKRKRGEKPAKPGEKGYPKTLDIDEEEEVEEGKKAPSMADIERRANNYGLSKKDIESYKKIQALMAKEKGLKEAGYNDAVGKDYEELAKDVDTKHDKQMAPVAEASVRQAFVNAARAAKAKGEKKFKFNGKEYPVTIKEAEETSHYADFISSLIKK